MVHRLAGRGRLVEQVGEQRAAVALAAMLGQERDVEDVVRAVAAIEIEPADVLAAARDDQPVGVRIIAAVVGVLGVRLHFDERGLLLLRPGRRAISCARVEA